MADAKTARKGAIYPELQSVPRWSGFCFTSDHLCTPLQTKWSLSPNLPLFRLGSHARIDRTRTPPRPTLGGDSAIIDPDVARELEASLRPLSHQPDVRDVVVALLDRASLLLAASWDHDREESTSLPLCRAIERCDRVGGTQLAVQLVRSLGPVASKLGDIPEQGSAGRRARQDVRSAPVRAKRDRARPPVPRNRPSAYATDRAGCLPCGPMGSGWSCATARRTDVAGGRPFARLARPREPTESRVRSPISKTSWSLGSATERSSRILLPMREMQAAETGEDFAVWLIEPCIAKVRAMFEVLDVSKALARGRWWCTRAMISKAPCA